MSKRASSLLESAPVFAALGDPVRLTMVSQLCSQGPLPTVQLKQRTKVSRQAVTKHLQLLEAAGLVLSQRDGRDRLWTINPRQLAEVSKHLDQISAQWDAAVERLRRFVEDEG